MAREIRFLSAFCPLSRKGEESAHHYGRAAPSAPRRSPCGRFDAPFRCAWALRSRLRLPQPPSPPPQASLPRPTCLRRRRQCYGEPTASRTSRKLGCVAARLLRGHTKKARPFGSFPKLGFCSRSARRPLPNGKASAATSSPILRGHPKPIRIPLTQIRPEERTRRENPEYYGEVVISHIYMRKCA